jgi:hypothetical protein
MPHHARAPVVSAARVAPLLQAQLHDQDSCVRSPVPNPEPDRAERGWDTGAGEAFALGGKKAGNIFLSLLAHARP